MGRNADNRFLFFYLKFIYSSLFCSGRYDYQTPYALVQEYCDIIEAPIKDDLVPKFSTFS